MSKEKRRVPKLRFPGFTEDWEQRKLSEVVAINPKTELPDEFKYVDLESVVGTNLLGFQVIKKENAPSRAQRLASYGDVFYQTVRPYQRNNYLFENVDKDMVFSTGYAQLRSRLDSYFLLTLVQNDNFVKVVLDNCTGTSYPAINGSELGKITVQIPPNEVEANQIGKIFRRIDKSITLHQRKLNNLKLKKKALLQKLFPKNGERYPELRFPGFTDAWEQRKLDELTIFIGDGLHGTPKYDENGSYYFINGNNLVDNKVSVTEETKKVAFEALGNDDRRLDSTAILMSINGTIGTLARYNNENIMLGKSVAYITPKNINRDFLFYQLQGNVIQSYFYKNLTGTTIKNLGLGTIKNTIVMSTLSEEESTIGRFFYKLDQYITLHQRKLDHLQLQKKALLQQMFV